MLKIFFYLILLLNSAYHNIYASDTLKDKLTPEEKKWLEKHQNIRLGFSSTWEPFLILNSDGSYSGIYPSILNELNARLKTKITIELSTWKEILEKAKMKKVDGILALHPDNAKLYDLIPSRSFLSNYPTIFSRKGSIIKSIEDLKSKRVSIIKGALFAENLLKQYEDKITVIKSSDARTAIEMVFEGKADAMLGLSSHNYEVVKSKFFGIEPVLVIWDKPFNSVMGIRSDWPELVSILNKGLNSFTKDEINNFVNKWINLPSFLNKIIFSDDERKWLKEHPVVRVGIVPEREPLEFIDNDGNFKGITISYLEHIEKIIGGIRFEILAKQRKMLIQSIKQKEIDIIASIGKEPKKEQYLNFTTPYLKMPIGIFAGEGITYIDSLNNLAEKKVLIIEGYCIEDLLRVDHPDIQFITAQNNREAMVQLIKGNAFAFIGSILPISYSITHFGYSQIKFVGETKYIDAHSIAVSKDLPILRNILQKALDAIPENERNEIYKNWISVNYKYSHDYALIFKIVIGASLLLIIFTVWNSILRKEIGRRKKVEEALVIAKQKSEAANIAKSLFLSNVSHELRTPLNAIIGYSQLMQNDPALNKSLKEKLSIIIKSGEYLHNLINEVLEISKIETGKASSINKITFDLHAMLYDIEKMFYIRTDTKGLTLSFEKTDDLPHYLVSDEVKLRQCLINLLGNAVKFTYKGAIIVRIFTGKKETETVQIFFEIKDSGIGINEKDIEKIFKPFEQAVAGNIAEGGTGLGLAITKEFAVLMEGNISVISKPDVGSTFTFYIKAGIGKSEEIKTNQPNRKISAVKQGQILPKILVVDDRHDNRKILSEVLTSFGFTVKEAVNGEEAINEFLLWHPALIFMDIKMPVMDGYEAIKRIRLMPEGANLPIVAVSASVFREDVENIGEIGANYLIRKPFKKEEIFEIIGELLNIEYEYLEEAPKENINESMINIIFKGLMLLPFELLDELEEAVLTLDKKVLISCIENIRPIIGETADYMIMLIEKYQFDTIDNLINNVKLEKQKKL